MELLWEMEGCLKPYADLVIGPSNEPGIYHTLKELHMID